MKKLLPILIMIICAQSYAFHKDRFFEENYGKVTSLTKVPFKNYVLADKARIGCKLTNDLSERLGYKDSINLYFCYQYRTNYKNETITSLTKDFNFDFDVFSKVREPVKSNSHHKGITLQIECNDFEIEDILKLIEYAIQNKIAMSEHTHYYFVDVIPDRPYDSIKYQALGDDKITEIKNTKSSKIISELLKQKTIFREKEEVVAYYQNHEFHVENKKMHFSSKWLVYLIEGREGFLFFYEPNKFTYLNSKTTELKSHELTCKANASPNEYYYYEPFLFEGNYNFHTKEKVQDGIYLFSFRLTYAFVFSENENKIIEEFFK